MKTESNKTHHFFVFLEVYAFEGGIQSYIQDILGVYQELELGYRAEVFLLRDSPSNINPLESESLKFRYFKTYSSQLAKFNFTLSLFKELYLKRPDHVFCGHIHLAVIVRSFCQILGIPYSILTYGKEVWEPLAHPVSQALKSAAGIWTISRYSCDRMVTMNNVDARIIQILPCAIDGNKFTPGLKEPELLIKYGLTDAKVLMTVARLWPGDIYKGVDVTIQAIPQIAIAFPEVKYLVIGRGEDQPRLAQLAANLGVSDRVIFAGFVPTEQLILHYRLADAYVMPSQEGFGIVYLEAMACGVPVLSGDDDGSSDPLQDGKLGWQVPHRNPDAVARACIEILQGNDQRCDGQWLRQQAIAIFGQAAFRKQLKQILIAADISVKSLSST